MPNGMDYILRPVLMGMCRYESIYDGSLTMEYVLIMNYYIDNDLHNRGVIERLRMQNGG